MPMSGRRARGATEQERVSWLPGPQKPRGSPTLKPARTGFIPTSQLRAATADTLLEHMCRLGIDFPPITARNTGVICTLGPASRSVETPQETMKSGMNVARVHLSLRTCGYQVETITALGIFASNPILYLPGAVALNTKGSEGRQHRGGRAEGSHVKITLDKNTADGLQAHVPGGGRGSKVWVADGLLSLPAKQKGPYILETEVESGGFLGSKKGVKLPLAAVHLPALSGEGIQDLKAGEEQDLDRVFASFTHRADDGREVGKILGERGQNTKLISKIETHEGMSRFHKTLEAGDGTAVAPSDAGIEIPAEKVFFALTMMIGQCSRAGKPGICATQTLESRIRKLRPASAEGSHVANTVQDGADHIMVSGEMANGVHPLEAVHAALDGRGCRGCDPMGTGEASFKCRSGAIIVLTKSGRSAPQGARYHPRAPIIADMESPDSSPGPPVPWYLPAGM